MDTLLTNKSTSDQVVHDTEFNQRALYTLRRTRMNQYKEEVTEVMGEPTIKEYITITRINYESGNDKGMIKLKGRFLLELQNNALSGTHGEDTMEHIKNFLEIVDSLNITNEDESIGSITNWVDLTEFFLEKFYQPSRTSRKIEANGDNSEVKWDPDNIEFELWLASKFRNHKTMDEYTKNALWNYWRNGNDKEVITDNELSNPRDDNLIKENEVAQIFRIDTDLFDFDTPLCQAFKEFNYLSQIDVDVLTNDIHGFKTYEKYKDDWIYEWNKGQEEQVWFDKHELMKDDDDDIGDLEDYLIQKDPPYYVNEEEERSKERRCKLLKIPYVKPPQ
ncbi:hypothetical protein Tco_1055136 [Tanacetum coccineum]|uniref:Uncharacterized protein n=1 Tax=Tanacetum coccineum TaxID=301880 RepID=A0ABQ5GZR5_9ASTR